MPKNYIQIFAKRFKQLNTGVIRLLIVIWIILLLIGLGQLGDGDEAGFFVLSIFYWFIIRIILWVYDGFKENEN
jgi:hypothetical protein